MRTRKNRWAYTGKLERKRGRVEAIFTILPDLLKFYYSVISSTQAIPNTSNA